ncbi:CbtA family protein [Oceanicella actignis]|uniref:Cobalt transporter subunit CbtA n=1 Tax=Oceanicella actignis TaxID=1189325 RepID=A0A1M7SP39_9RHOB|nr:CbtA family protein [Oceanicella actignis]SES65025.1 cobalt transporter subunit CbtA [Oceanicella actignis]SHN60194.1 cobalt transporter subunit CbtA [Oceanicella actignis]
MGKRLLASALFAGLLAGLVSAALQHWMTTPLILQAELYESGEMVHGAAHAHDGAHAHEGGHDHGAVGAAASGHAHDHDHGDEVGLTERAANTFMMTLVAMAGFGLLLTAGFALAERLGAGRVGLREGLMWGAAGFACTQLLTGAGLPPELPGSAAAPLLERQIWWTLTALLSAAGLAVLAWAPNPARWLGLALLALPHAIGAPHPEELWGGAPPELAGLFVARSLLIGAVGWTVLGAAAGWLWSDERRAA